MGSSPSGCTVIGGFSGALIAYSLGRAIGPSIITALTGRTLSFATGQRYLCWMIFTTRLLPVFSFKMHKKRGKEDTLPQN
jgi:uncharacterized membrane protein YdjX (TVP38/TMEM64 family)